MRATPGGAVTATSRVPARGLGATEAYALGLFGVLLVYYGGLYFLWAADAPFYWLWMWLIGVQAWDYPFLDLIAVLSWGDCHAADIDVSQINPCDPLGRPLVYSPVLLDLHLDWIGVRNAAAAGFVTDLAFLATMPAILRPNSLRALAIALVASLSPGVVFAMERGNLDVLILVAIAAAALYATRGPTRRLVSYGCYLGLGLLKYYPLVLLGLAARERPRTAFACAAAAATIIGSLAAYYWRPFLRALRHLPPTTDFGDTFGVVILPYGTARLLQLPYEVGTVFLAILLVSAALLAFVLARRLTGEIVPSDWDRPNHMLLIVGAFLTVGCFLAGNNVGYRVLILLFVIPGMLDLRGRARDRGTRRILAGALAAVLLCCWRQFFESGLLNLGLLDVRGAGGLLFLILRETVWWSLITILAASIIVYVGHTPVWRALTGKRHPIPS